MQILYFLIQPVVRRLFSIEDFGVYSNYMSMIGIVSVLSTLRYDDAIVLPSRDKDAANVLSLSLLFGIAINALVFIGIVIFIKKIPVLLNISADYPISILYMVPAGAFLLNSYQALNYWLIRKKKYTNVSVNKLVRRSIEGGSQIGFALKGVKTGLIFSDLTGQIANVAASIIQVTRNGFTTKLISRVKMTYVLRKYSEFPRFSLIPSLFSSIGFLLPPLIITTFYSAENTGIFDASKALLSMPLALVASGLSNVLLQKTSEHYNARKSLKGDLKNVLLLVMVISLAEIIVIMLFGPWIFKIYLGVEYEISGRLSRILVWSFVLNFLIASFSSLFYSLRKIKVYSFWQIIYFLAIISLFFFRHLQFSDFLKVYVGIEVTCYLLLIALIVGVVSRYERNLRIEGLQ